DDPCGMHRLHGVADLREENEELARRVARRSATIPAVLEERNAFDVVHDVIGRPARSQPAVMDRDDSRVPQPAEDPHFALEPVDVVGPERLAVAEDLDRDRSAGRLLVRLVDRALAAAVDLAEQLVPRDEVRRREAAPGPDSALLLWRNVTRFGRGAPS